MVNRRSSRIVGASRSNSHKSRNQSMNHRQPISASFYPGGQNVAGEGTSGPSLEERIRKMEESHNEILQLLRETRQSALPQREEVLLPRDLPGIEEVQPKHLQAETYLPPPRRHPRSLQDNELADTASSTHPSQTVIREIRNLYCISVTGRSIPGGFDPTSSTQVNVIEQGSDKQPHIEHTSLLNIIKQHSDKLQNSLDLLHEKIFLLIERGTGPEQGMLPVQSQRKASTEIKGRRKAKVVKLTVKLSVSKIQTQRHQIRLNPSPNESKSRIRSAVGRFKPQFELPNGFQMGHAYSQIERLDETNPTCPRSLNSDIIKISKCPSNEGTQVRRRKREEKKKKKREEGKEGRNSSSTTVGFRSDAGILSKFQITPEFCPTSKKGRDSARLLSDARILSNSQVMPEFSPTPK
ncbi:hypothetical protein M5K25_020941 [Dendrobium thyrsiflorum]|uniref:Uncharacterized protein n=1 Tax=Dendrobium thyrsiflorum TaxID=117978 RepID=A0ABD0UIJ7_DENTH